MVMAAGLGTRMGALTQARPKPLLPVAGRALLDHALDRAAEGGVRLAVVNVHHLADQVEAHLAGRTAPEIVISDEREALLQTLHFAMSFLFPQLCSLHCLHECFLDVSVPGKTQNSMRFIADATQVC